MQLTYILILVTVGFIAAYLTSIVERGCVSDLTASRLLVMTILAVLSLAAGACAAAITLLEYEVSPELGLLIAPVPFALGMKTSELLQPLKGNS